MVSLIKKIQTKERSGIGYLSISMEIHAYILVNKFTVYCKVVNERLEQLECSFIELQDVDEGIIFIL